MVEIITNGGLTMLSAISTSEEYGTRTINVVSADNDFFLHKQIESKDGKIFMRAKKRMLQ